MARERIMAVQLKVMEARPRDVGKCRARLDMDAMDALGVSPGDILELIGKEGTAATAWPADPEDQWLGIVKIDGQTRNNAGVALNEYVTVKKADAKSARSITLVPVSSRLSVDKEFSEFVKNRLKGMPLTEGDEISVVILGSPMLFQVAKIRPKVIAKVEDSTRLSILPEPLVEGRGRLRVTYDEVGGLTDAIARLREIVELPLRHPEVFQRLGIEPPKGILLYGPPGCGKTLLAKALANESEANFFSINGPEIMNKYYGESEARLREVFKEAKDGAPSVIFIDEIDAIAPKREEVFGEVEKRIVAQLLALMDGLSDRGNVITIGATNRPEGVDLALRRPGRFDREVEIGVPNLNGRLEILQIHTRGMPLSPDIDLSKLASESHGYTGADLKALAREAALKALKRHLPEVNLDGERIPPRVLEKMVVTFKDFKEAAKEIVPTALREFYVETPRVGWSSIGGLDDVKKTLEENIVWAIRSPERFFKVGVKPPKGVLMYGPSGCGKTMLARALATESGANFITVRGPEVLSKWVGESERAVRELFRKAKASAPCIIFFDEIDSIAKPRGLAPEESVVNERVLSQLLTEIDGIYESGEVLVVGATNRPDIIDLSLLRPGRLDLLVYVPPPDETARLAILRLATSKMPLTDGISLEALAKSTKGFSGADIEALCREAGIAALQRTSENPSVSQSDFESALKRVRASITPEIETWYQSLYKQLLGGVLRRVERDFYS